MGAPRILFASPHCLLDFSSGAAIATLDILGMLSRHGVVCRAFCASKLDLPADTSFEQSLVDARIESSLEQTARAGPLVSVVRAQKGPLVVRVLRTRKTLVGAWETHEPAVLLALYEDVLDEFRPDILLAFGGDAITQEMIEAARARGTRVVFGLHNLAYTDARIFRDVHRVIVPSDFARRAYERSLGLRCETLPYAIDWERVTVHERHPQYVTFVNPQPAKGLFPFARIAEQIALRRPDIPILVVESRAAASWLGETGLDLSWAKNLQMMENTHDARDFYAVTKILLVPSLVPESFGLVAAESMINGIPVLVSNRGALPEVVGEAGAAFHVPERYGPDSRELPTVEEMEPWVNEIVRLWDDAESYERQSRLALEHASRWRAEHAEPRYRRFLDELLANPVAHSG